MYEGQRLDDQGGGDKARFHVQDTRVEEPPRAGRDAHDVQAVEHQRLLCLGKPRTETNFTAYRDGNVAAPESILGAAGDQGEGDEQNVMNNHHCAPARPCSTVDVKHTYI